MHTYGNTYVKVRGVIINFPCQSVCSSGLLSVYSCKYELKDTTLKVKTGPKNNKVKRRIKKEKMRTFGAYQMEFQSLFLWDLNNYICTDKAQTDI